MSDHRSQRAQFDREIRAIVQRFSTNLRDDEIAFALVSQAFSVNMRKNGLKEAADRTLFSVDALREVFLVPSREIDSTSP